MNLAESIQTPVFKTVSRCAKEVGVEAYVVGGYVRDLLLKRPSKDIDFVCVGSGIALAEQVAKVLGPNVNVTVFKNFGTAHISFHDLDLEFVGARKESYRSDSRKPLVEDGSLADDQLRRDFTINAFAISLNTNNYGELVDPFNGLADLENKIIRTPLAPGITFSDDPLRMMRAIRFASQLNFDIEADTFNAITQQAERLSIISQERIIDELNKIVLSKTPSYGFKLLFQMTPKIFRRLKLPLNDRMDFVQKLVRLHLRPISLVKNVTDSAIRRLLFEAGDDVDALMTLCRADITSKNHEKVSRFLNNFDKVEVKMKEVEAKDSIRNFQPPISGEEIIRTFALQPGPIIGEIKEYIKEAILEGEIKNDYEEAKALMIKFASTKGLQAI
ncbi:MAG: CCA tRNA nucleotidyltransferase [Cytophagia bacterium]|nr:CCA tRNA nucleotidyltransferase [Cytophagia bacterium]